MKKVPKQLLRQLNTLKSVKEAEFVLNQPLLGIDYGEKFCGLAWSPDGAVVLPVSVVKKEMVLSAIETFLTEKKVFKIVIGLPLGSRNEENHICQQIRLFAKQLEKEGREIFFQNERFSSQEVIGTADRIDDLAAAKILEYWLEKN